MAWLEGMKGSVYSSSAVTQQDGEYNVLESQHNLNTQSVRFSDCFSGTHLQILQAWLTCVNRGSRDTNSDVFVKTPVCVTEKVRRIHQFPAAWSVYRVTESLGFPQSQAKPEVEGPARRAYCAQQSRPACKVKKHNQSWYRTAHWRQPFQQDKLEQVVVSDSTNKDIKHEVLDYIDVMFDSWINRTGRHTFYFQWHQAIYK